MEHLRHMRFLTSQSARCESFEAIGVATSPPDLCLKVIRTCPVASVGVTMTTFSMATPEERVERVCGGLALESFSSSSSSSSSLSSADSSSSSEKINQILRQLSNIAFMSTLASKVIKILICVVQK